MDQRGMSKKGNKTRQDEMKTRVRQDRDKARYRQGEIETRRWRDKEMECFGIGGPLSFFLP